MNSFPASYHISRPTQNIPGKKSAIINTAITEKPVIQMRPGELKNYQKKLPCGSRGVFGLFTNAQ